MLAVLKLENAPVSDHLQSLAGEVDNGKVKGLCPELFQNNCHLSYPGHEHTKSERVAENRDLSSCDHVCVYAPFIARISSWSV